MGPQTKAPQAKEAQPAVPGPCRHGPNRVLVRFSKSHWHDNGIYPCARCGFIFSSGNPTAQPTPQRAPQLENPVVRNKRTGRNAFTNFSEISYGKTRGSYDLSEIAARKQKFLLAHQFGATVPEASPFAGIAARTRKPPLVDDERHKPIESAQHGGTGASMNQKELLKGNTDTLLLSLLTQESMYGYQIVKEMERRSSGYFQFKEGTLYPALHRLEEARLVEGRWEEANMGTPRRYYHITAKGERVLSERTSEWNKFTTAVNAIMVSQFNSNTSTR